MKCKWNNFTSYLNFFFNCIQYDLVALSTCAHFKRDYLFNITVKIFDEIKTVLCERWISKREFYTTLPLMVQVSLLTDLLIQKIKSFQTSAVSMQRCFLCLFFMELLLRFNQTDENIVSPCLYLWQFCTMSSLCQGFFPEIISASANTFIFILHSFSQTKIFKWNKC